MAGVSSAIENTEICFALPFSVKEASLNSSSQSHKPTKVQVVKEQFVKGQAVYSYGTSSIAELGVSLPSRRFLEFLEL